MAVRSRPSLRFSVRRDQETLPLPPPTKRPRLHHDPLSTPNPRPHPSPSSSSSRRKSSPDLLESTIEDENTSSSLSHHKPRHLPARHHRNRSPLPTPRTSSRRPPLSSPHHHHHLPDSPRLKGILDHRHESPSSHFLRGSRESPDPLDTISPAPTTRSRPPPPPSSTSAISPSASTRSTRHLRPATVEKKQNPAGADKTPVNKSSAQKNRSTQQQQQLTPAPPPSGSPKRERRSLRSHDGGSRARSELALYFGNYEQLLSLEPPKTEILTGHTTIKLVDDLSKPPSAPESDTPFGNPLVQLHNCEVVEIPEPAEVTEEDPLNEAFYFRAHRRVERQEKQLRNIERERAQHEKLQLDRLLDELRSNDWLRVMGITGVTDLEEKKLYEPKRDFFVKEISGVIDKFKIWKEEEKRRKLEKEKAPLRAEATSPETAPPEDDNNDVDNNHEEDPQTNGVALSDAQSYGEPPDINDVDAWAARQLHQEARFATAGKRQKTYSSASRRKSSKPTSSAATATAPEPQKKPPPPPTSSSPPQLPLPPPPPDRPFTSFYPDPKTRAAALSPQNRKSQTRLAFGYPIPDMEEREFDLPPELVTKEMIRACQRNRRKRNRESRGEQQ
ncbi:hypothetical protein ASPWEDRAFT_53757 [Aspergillus wentii DTO 134E9]|uniref:Something about silencing protein 4 domain-containing protein n=1 Tax=Aspergillus wentii DTO 134E9 TaxID=1073089 RepID=A0A1L9RAV4_ASPWE|nr:uncharacterized protein ASPWEDRAFT_53757 [Aspergillus wentii DTO 134E9]OJJ32051.1 hypothetical protein ASPWEDRAFT_53757 [Aspergillus wentii DTO 134E9]